MGRFPFSFRSKVSGDSRLDLALASNFDKAATEDYVDAAVAAGGGGGGVTDHGALTGLSDDDHTQYHNDTRGDARYWQLSTDLATQAEFDAHLNDTTDAHDASAISIVDAAGDFTATDVEGALAELQAADEVDEAALASHLADTSDAHDASAISYAGGTGISATDVEAAIDELATEKLDTTSAASTYQPLDADLTTIAALDSGTAAGVMATEAAGWVKRTYAQVKTSLGLVKADVGLGNVDNTTDAGKPVSTAQQTALDLKANLASPTFTGAPSLPTAATAVTQAENDASTKLSTTAYVDRATGNASSNRPVGRAALTSAQSIGHNSWTAISFTSELTDTDSMVDIAGQPTRITCVTPGTYVVSGHVNVVGNATGRQGSRIVHKNSAGTVQGYYCAQVQENVSGGAESPGTSAAVVLAAGDYVQLECYQSSGGSLNTAAFSSTNHAELHAAWVGGTGAAWGNAGAVAYKSTTQAFTTGTEATITFDSEDWDLNGNHDLVTNNSRITCVVPGLYIVSGSVTWDANATGARYIALNKNGSIHRYLASQTGTTVGVGITTIQPYCMPIQMSTGDYFELRAYQASGGNLNVIGGVSSTTFGAVRVGYQTNPADLPGTYIASMYAANSGTPTHTTSGSEQKVGSGGGTLTWTSDIDKRPSGVAAQVDTATNKRIDIRKTGLYRVTGSVGFAAISDAKTVTVAVYKNGARVMLNATAVGKLVTPVVETSKILSLTSGDYLELYGNQDDSASEAYFVGLSTSCMLQAEYLGPAT